MFKRFLCFFSFAAALALHGEELYSNSLSSADAMEDWKLRPEVSFSDGVLNFELKRQLGGFPSSYLPLPPEKFEGRLVVISAEIRTFDLNRYVKKPYTGVKIQLFVTTEGKKLYRGIAHTREGSCDWTPVRQVLLMPRNIEDIKLQVGMQSSTGRFQMRNLKLESPGTPVPFDQIANMAFRDEKAADGRGGWSDQGPDNDGSPFLRELWRNEFQGFPFFVRREGKAVVTSGRAVFSFDTARDGAYLFFELSAE